MRDSQESGCASARVSVIVPVRNQAQKIEKCLEAVFDQSVEAFEVIVVDGHSTDDTVEIARRFPTEILYENYGTRAGANRVGIDYAKGDYVAFTDADCIPKRDWLENLLKEFEEGIVGVGGVVRNIGSSFTEDSINVAMGSFLGSAMSVQGRVFRDKRFVRSISGCNCMYRRKDLLDIGGFDVGLTTAEDTELNARLRKIGELTYTPEAVILHDHSRGLKEFAERMYQYGYGRGTSFLFDLQVVPPVLAVAVLLLPLLSFEAFVVMILLYFGTLLCFTLHISWKEGRFQYIASVPIIFLIVHTLYTLGIWAGWVSGVFQHLRSISRRSELAEERT